MLGLNALQLKIFGAFAIAAAAALAGVTIWAYQERAARLECKVQLVAAVDQVAVLAAALERQGAAIDKLGKTTADVVARTGKVLDVLQAQAAGDRKTIATLREQLGARVPTNVDGSAKGCADYLKEWRAEP